MKASKDAPFELGELQTALWFETTWSSPDEGDGSAWILLTDGNTSCSKLQDEIHGRVEAADSLVWKDSGVLLQLQWFNTRGQNIGFEGAYSAMEPLYGYGYYYYYYDYDYGKAEGTEGQDVRWFEYAIFSEGRNFSGMDYGMGALTNESGSASTVEGEVHVPWFEAEFNAKNCGRLEDPWEDSDWWHSGR